MRASRSTNEKGPLEAALSRDSVNELDRTRDPFGKLALRCSADFLRGKLAILEQHQGRD